MKDLILGIDIGTTAAKAALFSPDLQLQAVGQAEYSVQHIAPGWVEQHPEDWWQATCQAVRQALSFVEDGKERVAGIAVSSQAPTLIALDEKGRPVRPALIWMDRRAESEVHALNALLGADGIFRITGNRTDAFYIAAKLRWLREHEPENFARAQTFVQINGYINYRLTHVLSMDPVHAALLQLREYQTGAWSAALLEACGVTPDNFPFIAAGHQIIGEVTQAAAEEIGLRPGIPVMAGSVDGSAAAVEAGAITPGSLAEMTGTSTVMMMPAAEAVTQSAFIAMPHAIPGMYLLLAAMVASGASLRWFLDEFGAVEMQTAQRLGIDPFDTLTLKAADVPAGSDGVVFLPYMMGERAPIWHTNARGVFFGLSLATSKAAMVRAVLEGTAFAMRHNVEVAREAGIAFNELRSVGGGTRSRLWNQIKADVLGLPVVLPETSVGACLGDAVLVGMGLGLYQDVDQLLKDRVRIRTRFEPDMESHARYNAVYPIFRRIYTQLHDVFDDAAGNP